MAAFADVEALSAIGTPVADEDRAETLLGYASAIIRATFPDIDQRITDGKIDAALVEFVAVSMVKRALSATSDDATSVTDVAGIYQQVRAYSNGTGLYLSGREMRMLRAGGPLRRAFTVNPTDVGENGGPENLPFWSAQNGRWA